MNHEILQRGQPAIQRLLDRYAIDDEELKRLRHVLSLGCMCGTALASPILFEVRGIWYIDVSGFFLSLATFMLQNQAEIKAYGPFSLVVATFLGIAAYLSTHKSPQELVPWLPPFLCSFILMAAYFLPKLRLLFGGHNEFDFAIEEGLAYIDHGFPVVARSTQPLQDFMDNHYLQSSMAIDHWLDHDISYTGGAVVPGFPQIGRSIPPGSEIDLEDSQSVARFVARRMISPSRQGYNIGNLPMAASDMCSLSQRCYSLHTSNPLDQSMIPHRGSLSPELDAMESHSSIDAEAEDPLLR